MEAISAFLAFVFFGFILWLLCSLTHNNCEGVGHLPTEFTDETGHFLCERCCQWVSSPVQGPTTHGN